MPRKVPDRMRRLQEMANAVSDSSMAATLRQDIGRREKVRALFAPQTMGDSLRARATDPRKKKSGPPLKRGAPRR